MLIKPRAVGLKTVGQRCYSFFSPEFVLSELNIKKTVDKFATLKPIRMIAHEPKKRAGVLIPICVVDGRVELLYTRRAANLKAHRGQVSFPGGMQDVTDKNMEETAIRETHEELGIPESNIEIWGSGLPIVTKREISVVPVIARLKGEYHPNQIKVQQSEVEEAFTISLEHLCKPENNGYTQFRGAFASMPVYVGGKQRVWGLTALITHRFLTSLLPSQAYIHPIKYLTPVRSKETKRYGRS